MIPGEIGSEFGQSPLGPDTSFGVGARDMPRCDHCDRHVSENFARVFADARGRVHACPNCAANVGIAEVSKRRAADARAAAE